jgi:hypothetical protein
LIFERVGEFKYLGKTLTNQNSIQAEVKSRLKLGNACYYSVQNLLSFRLLSKNIKIKIYRTIILPVVLYGCEAWSLTMREERRLWVFENRVLRRVFGPKRDEVTGEWRKLHNEKLNVQEVGGGGGDWMERAQDRDRWRALVGTVMNFGVP